MDDFNKMRIVHTGGSAVCTVLCFIKIVQISVEREAHKITEAPEVNLPLSIGTRSVTVNECAFIF